MRTASTDYTATSFLFHTPEISIALDLVIHGSARGPSDSSGNGKEFTNYTAFLIAQKLKGYGLKEVGVLRLDSCNVGSGFFLKALKSQLEKADISFGYLSSPKGLLQAKHLPLTEKRPIYQLKFWEPWNTIKGNLDISFPNTKYLV